MTGGKGKRAGQRVCGPRAGSAPARRPTAGQEWVSGRSGGLRVPVAGNGALRPAQGVWVEVGGSVSGQVSSRWARRAVSQEASASRVIGAVGGSLDEPGSHFGHFGGCRA